MATAAEVARHAAALDDVVSLAYADLAAWWAGLDIGDAAAAASALAGYLPALVALYGDMAAALAADFYDQEREQSGAPGAYRARMADPVPPEQAAAVARWAVGPLFGGEGPRAALEHAAGGAQRLILQLARDTIDLSVRRDPARPRWARMPRGRSCAFCRMLAGRGAVYATDRAAGQMRSWHNHCRCVPVPVWPGQDLPYDAEALEREYLAARERAGSGNPRQVLAQMRQDLGVK